VPIATVRCAYSDGCGLITRFANSSGDHRFRHINRSLNEFAKPLGTIGATRREGRLKTSRSCPAELVV
jgi:hypothetical protein